MLKSIVTFISISYFLLLLPSCKDSKVVSIEQACCSTINLFYNGNCYLSLANMITPNKDGINDVFRMHYKADCPISDFELKIENYKIKNSVLFETTNPNFRWKPEITTSGFAVYKLTMSCYYAGKTLDIEQPITLYDRYTYLYDPITLECCASCVLPDMFVEGDPDPSQATAELGICE